MLDRRAFLLSGLAVYGASARELFAAGPPLQSPTFPTSPFTLGVASGDPAPDGVVLWTRLALDPLNGGGMPAHSVVVRWRVAKDEKMHDIVQSGTALATAALGHSVHVELTGLEPARWYWYQFTAGGVDSPRGRSRTAPAAGASLQKLTFAVASCQSYPAGYFTAYQHMAKEELDLVVFLGDYIYEGGIGNNTLRKHNS